ncbi:MAG TPA: fasciclin domain-containing protein [Streptomyces sp.]|nr:fasciclin domain-containing protein [Streptomyces sp.]
MLNRRGGALASLALLLATGLSACGTDSEAESTAGSGVESSMTEQSPQAGDAAAPGTEVFGEGCKLLPTEGPGSLEGMATAPVATAASNNPLLKTLTAAVGAAGLAQTLDNADALTVFAPTDDAFAEIPQKDLEAVLADKEALTGILTHHVVAGQLGPDELVGEHKTLAGDTLTVAGAGESFTVGDENAKVLCGNIATANATVYVIDTVLKP